MNENEGPQGLPPGWVDDLAVKSCCLSCVHFRKEKEGNQSPFVGDCSLLKMEVYEPANFACPHFKLRPFELVVAEKLAGRWLGKYRD